MALLFAALLGYLLGSVPYGLLLTRAAGLGDIRAIGSGNIGATNVLRTGNKALAAATLVLDVLKGVAALLIARVTWGEDAALVAGFAALAGHVFPVWLGFRGGKGVATGAGVLMAAQWWLGLAALVAWAAVFAATRISSASLARRCTAASMLMPGRRAVFTGRGGCAAVMRPAPCAAYRNIPARQSACWRQRRNAECQN
jgi:glycerol-3-phosphate acyltransferase PlsY